MTRVLYLIFFASGATGLVYQVLWLRLTGLVFGNTSFAIAAVLGAFMAGLALGNWRLGIVSDRVARPLRMYGILEILIGVTACLVPVLFHTLESAYWGLAPALAAVPGFDFFTRFSVSFAIMLIPTFLMGGTLPVMVRLFVRQIGEVESRVATLYALNTFGAALGVLLAALVLIPRLGNQATTISIAVLNVALGLTAIALDRYQQPINSEADLTSRGDETTSALPTSTTNGLVLATLLVSGFVALTYEVAWTRALSALISNSTYAFAIMLVTFLVGIALGSSWAARYRPHASLRLAGLFQLAIAAGGIIFLLGFVVAPTLLVSLVRALFYSFAGVLTIQFAVASALMIFATFFMGATLPICAQLYSTQMKVLGRRVGSAYSINTLGAILGALCAGFVLIPIIGTERTVLLGVLLNAAMAIALFSRAHKRSRLAQVTAAAIIVLAAISMRGEVFWKPGQLDRGVLIYAQQFEARPTLRIDEHYEETDVVYFREGKNASVSVRRGSNYVGLRTNGKVDASNGNDKKTQLLLSYLPGLHHASAEDVLVIGYGSGITTGAATVFPRTRRVDTVEIEPAVVAAAPWFAAYNRRSWENSKVRLIEDDARNFLNVANEHYDIIISEPSNPWIAGMGNLFTADFYELVARSLRSDGVFAQWLPLYELSPQNVRMVIAEIQRHFPEVSIWHMDEADVIILASGQPLRFNAEELDRLWTSDASVRRDFREFLKLNRPLGLLSQYIMDASGARDFAGSPPRNTDDKPLLEYNAPRNLYAKTGSLNIELLNEHKTRLLPAGLSSAESEQALVAIIDPMLRMNRFEFADKAIRELARMPRGNDTGLYLSMASATIHTTQFTAAEDALLNAEQAAEMAAEPATASVDEMGSNYAAYLQELRGRLMERRGNRIAAIRHYTNASNLDASRPDYLLKIANLYAVQRQWESAAEWMRRYIQTDPYPVANYWELFGDYALAAGREGDAVAAFQSALEHDPYTFQARLQLAAMHEQQGAAEKASELLEFLTQYAVDRSPDVYSRLAKLYKTQQKWADARRVLNKGVRIFPTSVDLFKQREELQSRTD